jgi:spermidine/putrescine transport system substrate-binding protein
MAQRKYEQMSRRAFIKRAGGVTIALPSAAAILAACAKPQVSSPGGSGGPGIIPIARQDAPVTLPLIGSPIAADTPVEEGTLEIYNWDSYMWKSVLADWENLADRTYEWTTFNNTSEMLSKLQSGQVVADVTFPTVNELGKMVQNELLQPIQHEMLPNIGGMWPEFSADDSPWYDQGWRYTVPYTIYTTGIGFNRTEVDEDEVAERGYDILWDTKYAGKIGIYDDYREALSMAMYRRGLTDPNTGDEAVINQAKDDLIELVQTTNARITINGAFDGIPTGKFSIHQAWSGDMIGAQQYLPAGVSPDILGYVLPEIYSVGNDLMAVPSSAEHPAMGHDFINFFISDKYAVKNFSWNGYQPPLTSMQPNSLIAEGYVPQTVPEAVVKAQDFTVGHFLGQLDPEVNRLWQNAWDEVKAGA